MPVEYNVVDFVEISKDEVGDEAYNIAMDSFAPQDMYLVSGKSATFLVKSKVVVARLLDFLRQ